MNIGQLLGKIATFAKKTAVSMKIPKSATIVDKINATFSSKTVGVAAKKLGLGLVTANLTDKYIKDVPVANNIYNWYATTLDEIYEKTIRQTPVIGDWLRKITDFINKLIVPNAQNAIERNREMKHLNNPKWYTGLDMHTQFKIPFVYPDNRALKFGSDISVASVALLTLGFNPMADCFAVKSRLTQELDLLKGLRGLSGRLPYTMGDLFYYHLATYYLLNEYHKLKFSLRLSNYYSLNKSRMPGNVMAQMGWDFDDFIQNKALYETLLLQIYNAMSNTVPLFGTITERITSMWDCFIPDSNDAKVALFYKYYPIIDAYLPSVDSNGTATYERFGDKFFDFTPDKNPNDDFEQAGKTYNMQYSTYSTNVLSFLSKIAANDIFTNIKGDMIGAFGSSGFYVDKQLNNYKDANILGTFDELILTQIQNATPVELHGKYVNDPTVPGGSHVISEVSPDKIYYTLKFGGTSSVGTVEMPYSWSGSEDNTYVGVEFNAPDNGTGSGYFVLPAVDGRDVLLVGNNVEKTTATDNLTIIANKYNTTEGEDLEILQFFAQEVSGNGYLDVTGSEAYVKRHYLTNSFYVKFVDILYTVGGVDYSVRMESNVAVGYSGLSAGGQAAQYEVFSTLSQFWSQADYMYKLHLSHAYGTFMALANITTRDNMLLDYNIMGSISSAAFRQAIKYSTYSMYAASLKITETKRVSNVADVYNKTNK